jgi:wyosine [tRNA(Phe)-imidazoG37] synthetase (radical SAM superfamily)
MLHVLVSGICNNNCVFCMEADRDLRRAAQTRQSPADVQTMIAAYPSPHGILFTSGEPTLSRELLGYVRLARARGFADIALITNGRCLAYPDLTRRLVEAGVNRITISIHGHEARLHDGLTRTPGSFAQTRQGLDNVALLKTQHRLRLHTSTVVTRRNLPHFAEICDMLTPLAVDTMVFNIMMAVGRGAVHLTQLMPRYHEIVTAVQSLCATQPRDTLARLRVEDLPDCVARLLPESMRGRLEAFHQFEATGSSGVAGVQGQLDLGVSSASTPVPGHLPVRGDLVPRSAGARLTPSAPGVDPTSVCDLVGEQHYYLTDRRFKDAFQRSRGEPCGSCARTDCPGVWQLYAAEFGWSEFSPIAPIDHVRTLGERGHSA